MVRGWLARLKDRWDEIRGSYWFFPAQLTTLAAVAALTLVEFDRYIAAEALDVPPWLGKVTADGARSVLSTVAGSMMTVTGVVFSITVVALTLASSQFGPRLLRTFFRDHGSQTALGTFLATFLFNLLVLRAVENTERVPIVATGVAVLLAVASLFVLIYYIHHAATSIQASSVVAAVAREIEQHLPLLFPESLGSGPERGDTTHDRDRERLAALDEAGDAAVAVRASGEGYIRVVDEEALLGIAAEYDLLFRVVARPGDFVVERGVLAHVEPASDATPQALAQIRQSFLLGDQRTPVQDLAFSIGQLVQMAVRAMSPGINDPATAIACIHRLGGLLSRLIDRDMPSGRRFDASGRLRVVVEPTRYADLVATCFDSIRHYGAGDPDVAVALLDAIRAAATGPLASDRVSVLEQHVAEVRHAYARTDSGSKRDLARVDAAHALVLETLAAASAHREKG